LTSGRLSRQALTGHIVSPAFEMGWSEMADGDLLNAAETEVHPHVDDAGHHASYPYGTPEEA